MLKMAVLLSGSGRTLDNFQRCIAEGSLQAKIEVVIANVEGVLGLEKAEGYGIPAHYAPSNEAINEIIAHYDIDIICLAGYLKLYTPPASLRRAVVNIHPSLIPAFCGEGFYGSRVHRAVKAQGCTVSGCTVHFANEVYDEGPIILQKAVELDDDDSAADIAARVFAAECEAFPEAISLIAQNGIEYYWSKGVK